MSDWREDLLTEICDCGYGDLYLLEDCEYDLGEIVEECQTTFGNLKINNLVRTMFDFGLRDIEDAIKTRLAEFDDIVEEKGRLSKAEIEERDALETLEPFEDMQSFHNYIDTHIWVDAKEQVNIYPAYMQEALNRFCEMTGFEIGTDYAIR